MLLFEVGDLFLRLYLLEYKRSIGQNTQNMKRSQLMIAMLFLCLIAFESMAQNWQQKFEQLGTTLPTGNSYRTASGAPGSNYWQQKADYLIDVEIDDSNQKLTGHETITYFNQSPDVLEYLWVQLDQNVRAAGSDAQTTRRRSIRRDSISAKSLQSMTGSADYEGGYNIVMVLDASGKPLDHTINKTMMRIDLPSAMNPGDSFTFSIDWSYNVYDRMFIDGCHPYGGNLHV